MPPTHWMLEKKVKGQEEGGERPGKGKSKRRDVVRDREQVGNQGEM